MDLSSEDALRLNVLLANQPQAIRIDESSMTLYGLSEKGEAKVALNPNCRDDLYLRKVREVLSGHVLGSPGGYPIYLKRWSRMGQTRDENLEQLLLLGEPEAVVAVTGARGLSDELARRAWWTRQDPDNARRMLNIPAVVEGRMGAELAQFLIEYLPFETEPLLMFESLRLSLQPGLLDEQAQSDLWKRCQRKPTYYLGFLASLPDAIPGDQPGRGLADRDQKTAQDLSDRGNVFATQLLRAYSPAGQNFFATALRVMEKPANQDVVTLLLDILRDYLSSLRPTGDPDQEWGELVITSRESEVTELQAAIDEMPEMEEMLRTLYLLSGVGYGIVRPIFSKTDAIGSLMRKKLQPVSEPLQATIRSLLATS